jgi:hypothetical protein
MDNFKTIEVRWFYPGVIPVDLLTWFDPGGEPSTTADSRTDVYLQSDDSDMGIKLRQGNLEVKYRQTILRTIELEGFGSSQIEQWTKWICVDDSSALTADRLGVTSGWIKVAKIRSQRLYQVNFTDKIQLESIAKPQADAAAIEIAQLQVEQQIWWTIACEYLGDKLDLDRQFLPLVSSLLSACPVPRSTRSISCGYPQWLNFLRQDIRVFTD